MWRKTFQFYSNSGMAKFNLYIQLHKNMEDKTMSKIESNKGKITLLEMRTQYLRILKEVGDLENVEAYPYKDNSFTADENWTVEVDFDIIPFANFEQLNLPTKRRNTFNVSYEVNGYQSQYKKTTYKQLLRILKTVSDIVKNFIKDNNTVEALSFLAANKDPQKLITHTDPQKSAIYKSIIVKNISKLDSEWKLRDVEIGGPEFAGFVLIKTKK